MRRFASIVSNLEERSQRDFKKPAPTFVAARDRLHAGMPLQPGREEARVVFVSLFRDITAYSFSYCTVNIFFVLQTAIREEYYVILCMPKGIDSQRMQQRRQINKRFLGQSRGFSALFFGYKLYVLCTSSLSLYCTFLFVQRRPPFPLMLCRLSHPQISRREKKEGKIFTEGRATSTRRTFLLGGQGEKRFTTFNETRFF